VPGARILLVDDERDIRYTLANVMRRAGFDVTEAIDGNEALHLLRKNHYDVCISDVCMPGLGGFGLVAALRFGEGDTFSEHRGMPVVLLSGQVSPAERARALDAGVDEFLVKPIEPEEFLARLRAVLRRVVPASGMHASTRGSLDDFGLPSLAQALAASGRTARVRVNSGNIRGVLDFHNGQISHATFDDGIRQLQGETAAVQCFMILHGGFEIMAVPKSSPKTVHSDTDGILLRAVTQMDEDAAGMQR
jgi:DNA-binding response OmpR family regulator